MVTQTQRIPAVHDSGERSPLLGGKQQSDTYVAIPKDFPLESEPEVAQELRTLLSLVYPVSAFSHFLLWTIVGIGHAVLAGVRRQAIRQDRALLPSWVHGGWNLLCAYFCAELVLGGDSAGARAGSRGVETGADLLAVGCAGRTPLVAIAAIGAIVNAVSGYLLTYYTPMGFEGIALSRSLGNMALPLLLMPYFYCHPHHLSQWWRGWNLHKAQAHVGMFLRLGVPGALMLTFEWWAFEVLTLMAGVLPDAVASVSAHAVQVNVNNMIYMVFWGLAVAANVRIGNCLGANSPRRARLACKVAQILALTISVTFAAVMFLFRGSIPSLFLTDRESIERSASLLAVWAPFEILDGQNTVLQGVYRGLGKQKVAATISGVAYYACGIPQATLLGYYFALGVEGLWLGYGVGVFMSVSLLLFMLLGRWSWEELATDAQKRTAH
ncbi:hypothetical protein ON010_g12117 [Phytophthora cinnamomi]|nr:hypothetical protein ON010_g12117 [Phytophthora cinnamomi]